jgi:hypothetical protein
MPKINKNVLLAIALLIVAVVGYFLFMSKDSGPAPLTETQAGAQGAIGQEIVIELNRLRSLQNISTDIFKNSAFASLKDYTQVVVPQPVGRPNPFAPVGQ